MRWAYRLFLFISLVTFVVTTSDVRAQEPGKSKIDQARELGEKGVALFDAGKFNEALEPLRRAEELHHAPTLRLYIARSYDKLGRLQDALAEYREILAEELPPNAPDQYGQARAAAHAEVDLLIPRIPTVTITPSGAPPESVSVKVNGRDIPRIKWPRFELDPGEHTFEAFAEGYADSKRNVVVPEGARSEVTLELTREATAPINPPVEEEPLPLFPAWVGLGAGGAALAVGAITGGLHLSQVSDLKSRCQPDNRCPQSDAEDASDARTLATVSTVTFIVGGVLAAAGATYAIVAVISDNETAAIELAPTRVNLRLRF